MIFEPQKYSFLFQDAVYSLAVGFMAAVINRRLSLFLYRGRVKLFIKDVLMSVVFAVLIFSYCVSFANYNVLRWYNVMVAVVGFIALGPGTDGSCPLFVQLLSVTVKHLQKKARSRVIAVRQKIKEKNIEKQQKFTQKTEHDTLKEQDVMLYN